jgi:hypothetical protein
MKEENIQATVNYSTHVCERAGAGQATGSDGVEVIEPITVKPVWYTSSLGRYVFGSEISYNKAPPRLPGLGC